MMPRIGSLCSGYRGLDMAVEEAFGGSTAWVSDIDPGASKILAHHWPTVPNLGDLKAVDWAAVDPVDIVCGGYPCPPFSTAGRREGTTDARNLWPHIATALRVLRPRYAIFENVAGHLSLGFDTVLADLARLGFDAEWCIVRADEIGAAHRRARLIVLASLPDAPDLGHERGGPARRGWAGPADGRVSPAHTDGRGLGADEHDVWAGQPDATWGRFGPAVGRWAAVLGRPAPLPTDALDRLSPAFVEWLMGLPAGHVTAVPGLSRTQQLKALGNGVVPQQAAAALRLLTARAEGVAA